MCRATAPVNKRRVTPNIDTLELKDIRACIPAHLQERSLVKSSFYLVRDLIFSAILLYLSGWIGELPYALRAPAWCVWWYVIGAVWTGIWVIAHECGHQAFSDYGWVNDLVGWVFHSALLVPYFSWKYTHAQHHSGTGDMKRDTVHLPMLESEFKPGPFDGSPLRNLVGCAVMLLAGWPAYLIFNTSGQRYNTAAANHFNPYSPFFRPSQRKWIVISDIGLLLTFSVLGYWAYQTSLSTVLFLYGVPYLFVNAFLVLITYLQHTHKDLPHLRHPEWTFVRGALCTVDRSFGPFLNFTQHNICDSHIVHHLFSTIPHYHAIQATPYVKEFLGDLYHEDNSNIWVEYLQTYGRSNFKSDEGSRVWWQTHPANAHAKAA